MSTTAITGGKVMDKLRTDLVSAKERGIINNSQETKVLILTGSHGDNESGASGLTDRGYIDYDLYEHDCRRVGLRSYPEPLSVDEHIEPPDINKIKRINA